jgi:DNA-binding transcriptional LysR family regulator
MDIRHLRNMLAVIQEGSLARAAQRLNISQPALTKSVKRLEDQMGVPLFERGVRGMRPTLYAENLKLYAKAACVGMIEAERQISALRKGAEGEISIAAPPLIMTNLLPGVIARLAQERPRIKIRLVSQNRGLFNDLLEGKFNIAVTMLYNEAPKPGLSKQWLFDDRLALVVGPHHPLAQRKKVTAGELRNQKWIFSHADNWGQRRLQMYFEQFGFDLPEATIESHDHAVMKSLIMASDYVGLIARLGIQRELSAGAVKCIDMDSPLMVRPIGIVRRANEQSTPAIETLVHLIKEESAQHKSMHKRRQRARNERS